MVNPSPEEYRRRALAGLRVPVWIDLLADVETPVGAYWKLAQGETHSFLLESVTGGEQLGRYSIIGVRPRDVVRVKGGKVKSFAGERPLDEKEDPLGWLRGEIPEVELFGLGAMPKLIGGAVGFIGYDYVRSIERLPQSATDDLDIDLVAMMLVDCVVVFDHAKNRIRIVFLADGTEQGYQIAIKEIARIRALLEGPLPPLPHEGQAPNEVVQNRTREDYEGAVRRIVQYIEAGDCIQVVPSLRFSTKIEAQPISVYRALRSLNPSPYMFLMRFGDFDIVGASPESLVGLEDGVARVRPIAGTRPRGESEAEDARLATELLADEKERAEHVMLVDLGRNDLGKVCDIGSVDVDQLMVIERYSHVMHIVSNVTGTLSSGLDAVDLVRAVFPAGTVSGAPKVRAMQIIEELEPTRRGLYAGAAGYFSAGGHMDLAIAIRTILIKDGTAHVQAGAGIVYDSIAEREYDECVNKARASLAALERGQSGNLV
ncbi:MAG: anthranilate synthase component I [Fimbriimonadaceae bacterium]|nr:anthranilate synthase component I [Fimbriimonadaceae bacterium]QYK54903.1 MAG: anthranilate synthase component I [Fimbriimonadaceae bacterium]